MLLLVGIQQERDAFVLPAFVTCDVLHGLLFHAGLEKEVERGLGKCLAFSHRLEEILNLSFPIYVFLFGEPLTL